MLPQHLRLRKGADFALVIKRGCKVRRPTLVLYAQKSDGSHFGVVVGKRVGNAVVRNSVKRRLRHQAALLMDDGQPMNVVVRALPGAGESAQTLRRDLIDAWSKAIRKKDPR